MGCTCPWPFLYSVLEDALCVWTKLGKHSLIVWICLWSIKTGQDALSIETNNLARCSRRKWSKIPTKVWISTWEVQKLKSHMSKRHHLMDVLCFIFHTGHAVAGKISRKRRQGLCLIPLPQTVMVSLSIVVWKQSLHNNQYWSVFFFFSARTKWE